MRYRELFRVAGGPGIGLLACTLKLFRILGPDTGGFGFRTLGDRLDTWNVEAQRGQLVAAKVKYVVLRPQVAGAAASTTERPEATLRFTWRPEDAPRSHYEEAYTLVRDDPDLAIFRVY